MMRHTVLTSAALCAALWVTSSPVQVQTPSIFYVRAGASGAGTGTGSDWSNAYTTLPSALQRGATYFIADGTYGGYTFDDATSGASPITIKKATISDHGTDTGWLSTYGDGQASFDVLSFSSNYWVLDGNTKTQGMYGFVVSGQTASGGHNLRVGQGVSATLSNISIYDLSVDSRGVGGVSGIGLDGVTGILLSNVETWNCDADPVAISYADNVTFEYLYIHTRNSAGIGTHADAMQIFGGSNNVLRHSRIDWDGQQIFWGGGAFTHGRWDIYGNRFYGGSTSGKGLHPHSTDPPVGPINVYNNTFSGLAIAMDLGGNTTGEVKNNVFFDLGGSPGFGRTAHDYNWFETGLTSSGEQHPQFGSNPFVDLAAEDFQLRLPIGQGSPLSSPYNIDPSGRTRGADGLWDLGTFEFAAIALPPAPPTNVRIIR